MTSWGLRWPSSGNCPAERRAAMLPTAVMVTPLAAFMTEPLTTFMTVPPAAVPSTTPRPSPGPPSVLPSVPRPAISSAIPGVPTVFRLISAAAPDRLRKL